MEEAHTEEAQLGWVSLANYEWQESWLGGEEFTLTCQRQQSSGYFSEAGLRRDIYKMPVFGSHVFCEQRLLFSREKPTLTSQLLIQFQAV